ncbi:hypothetical protein CIB95_15560 [Lottiidibacillus patelloidae]|uniref:Uncharacterized protein n=1 Tax=Lottiidibacillus patelloidae TaxID=2670334 RepID=A0A263BQD2_9BACI|nr:hypothetical protein [Lottiidibacillus patelloidae]OZM55778.1 hypothetical protein CIB95_15560 [Lottiidibacillus patelloidae]
MGEKVQENQIRHLEEFQSGNTFYMTIVQILLVSIVFSLFFFTWLSKPTAIVFCVIALAIIGFNFMKSTMTTNFLMSVELIVKTDQPEIQYKSIIANLKVQEKIITNRIEFWKWVTPVAIFLTYFGAETLDYMRLSNNLLTAMFIPVLLSFLFLYLLTDRKGKMIEMIADYELELEKYQLQKSWNRVKAN